MNVRSLILWVWTFGFYLCLALLCQLSLISNSFAKDNTASEPIQKDHYKLDIDKNGYINIFKNQKSVSNELCEFSKTTTFKEDLGEYKDHEASQLTSDYIYAISHPSIIPSEINSFLKIFQKHIPNQNWWQIVTLPNDNKFYNEHIYKFNLIKVTFSKGSPAGVSYFLNYFSNYDWKNVEMIDRLEDATRNSHYEVLQIAYDFFQSPSRVNYFGKQIKKYGESAHFQISGLKNTLLHFLNELLWRRDEYFYNTTTTLKDKQADFQLYDFLISQGEYNETLREDSLVFSLDFLSVLFDQIDVLTDKESFNHKCDQLKKQKYSKLKDHPLYNCLKEYDWTNEHWSQRSQFEANKYLKTINNWLNGSLKQVKTKSPQNLETWSSTLASGQGGQYCNITSLLRIKMMDKQSKKFALDSLRSHATLKVFSPKGNLEEVIELSLKDLKKILEYGSHSKAF